MAVKDSRKLYPNQGLTPRMVEIRDMAMASLPAFVALVSPQRLLGHCHIDMLDLLANTTDPNLLILWPRGHGKSFLAAMWCAWHIVKNPDTTILYASDSLRLAQYQLGMIKTVLESEIVRRYWPGLVNEEESKRETWRQDALSVDHWKRKAEAIRDPTIVAVGMGANITGSHVDVVVLDDIVVYENSATVEERNKSKTWFSLLSSILNPGGIVKAVGTRYHPLDLYQNMMDMEEETFDEKGNVVDTSKVYRVSERVVEIDGQFLWPKQKRNDGKWFGFDRSILSTKRSAYLDKAQFYAQYYNNPSDPDNKTVTQFDYYDPSSVNWNGEFWFVKSIPGSSGPSTFKNEKEGIRLNVYAAIDFASTLGKKSDYTTIAVIGIDSEHNIFVLDLQRFKTDKISVMQEALAKAYAKWRWIKLRGEATAAQNLVVQQIKDFNRKQGIFYSIEIFKPISDKITRIKTTLEPRYAQNMIYHFRGGLCELLELELASDRSPHDDLKDALASAVEIAIPPVKHRKRYETEDNLVFNVKFGGIV